MLHYHVPEGVNLTKEQKALVEEVAIHLNQLIDLNRSVEWLKDHPGLDEIIVFGSQINGCHHETSDLDVIFHSETPGAWWDQEYCKAAYEQLLTLCESFKTCLKQELVLDAMLSQSDEDYWGVINQKVEAMDQEEYSVSAWDYSDLPYYFTIDLKGLTFYIEEGADLANVFKDYQFASFF